MVDTNKLKAAWVEKGLTQTEVAKMINLSARTFSNRMKKGVFGSNEIEQLMRVLDIKNPVAIFFAQTVTYKDTKQQKSA